MPGIRMRYFVSSGILVPVLLLCNEAWVVQAADSGASVSPSAPGFSSPLITYSSTSMTVTISTEGASFTSQLKDTPVPTSSPQPSASSSAPVEAMTSSAVSTTLPLPSSSPEQPPKRDLEGKFVYGCTCTYLTGRLAHYGICHAWSAL